ncbi:MAG TPA: DUF3592 domain-containing protein [Pseudonocardiaceae bacterium]|jgi:hypothetical protein|nr:DUF3592 domain-containing protein [Pseudonocardiaceae bacterium]
MIYGIVGMVVGGSFSILATIGLFQFFLPTMRALRRDSAAPGTIVGSRSEEVDSKTVYHPIVEFATVDGQRVEYQDARTATEDFRIGDEITVYYDHGQAKSSATTIDRSKLTVPTIGFGFFAVFFAGMFVVGLAHVW